MSTLNPLVYTIPQVAAMLLISESHAYNLASSGILPVTRLGRREMVQKADLDDFLRKISPVKRDKVETKENDNVEKLEDHISLEKTGKSSRKRSKK